MNWRDLPRQYVRRLKATLLPEALALIGISIGVALLFASQVAGGSLSSSASRLATSVLGSVRLQLQARSPEGMDESIVRQVQALPGVHAATAVVEASGSVVGRRGRRPIVLVGVEPNATHLGGAAVRKLSSEQLAHLEAVALPEGVASAIGAGGLHPLVTLDVAGHAQPALVGLEVKARESALIASSPLVVASLGFAQSIASVGHRVTRVFVTPTQGEEKRVRRELNVLAGNRLNVKPADFDATLFATAAAPINQSTTLFSTISAVVGGIFAFYAMLLTVNNRQRYIALLRKEGFRRRKVAKVLFFDALVLGVCSALLGWGLGELVSRLLIHANPGYLIYAFPIASQRQVTDADIGLAMAAAMLAAFVGVFAPARGIFGDFRLQMPIDSERLAKIARNSGAVAGVICLVITTVILYWAPQLALYGMASLTMAVLLLLPMVLQLSVSALTRLRDGARRGVIQLGLTDLRYPRHLLRSIAIAATGAVAIFGSVSIGSARENLQKGLNNSSASFNGYGEIWVTASAESDLFTTTPLSAAPISLSSSLRALPGVRSVAGYGGSYLDLGSRRVWVLAPPMNTPVPISPTQLLEGSLPQATRHWREGWIAVSRAIAIEHHLHIGGYFSLASPVPERLRVAAVITNLGWSAGAMILNDRAYARAWGSATPSAYLVDVQPGANLARVQAEIRGMLGPKSGLAVETTQHRIERGHAASGAGLSQLTVLSWMVLGAAILTMGVAVTTMLWQRKATLASRQVNGKRRGKLVLSMLLETAALLGTGCLTGALMGIFGQLLLSHALATVTGFPVVTGSGALIALASCAAVTAIAVAAVAIPGYAATRVPLVRYSVD